jgi:CRP-like cAMP-binding protein
MSPTGDLVLSPMVRKLEHWYPLSEEERRAILDLPHVTRDLVAGHYLVWEGDRPRHVCLLLSGFAVRHKESGTGVRQILSIHMKGDPIDLQNSLLGVADHNVQMITAGTIAMIPVQDVVDLAFRLPAVGMAMWYETLVEASIFREWMFNVGRRDAFTKIAHLLCEFALRLETAELGKSVDYELPFTQEQLADATGLTAVHVNRTLMRLETEKHIRRSKRSIQIDDWKALAKIADFDPRYLHMDGVNLPPGAPAGMNSKQPGR